MKRTVLIVAALAFAACGKKSSKPAAPSCAEAMKGMTEGFTRQSGGMELPPEIKKVLALMATKCEAKQWPAGMIECYSAAVGDDSKPEEVSKSQHCMMGNAAFVNEVSAEALK